MQTAGFEPARTLVQEILNLTPYHSGTLACLGTERVVFKPRDEALPT